ncbi:sigma 54 modulation/S30EA ribosomal C-terminal domain-containing protein [Kitasatospora sp. SUK 42]|uniref:sigma 54 modulation/S30EA ribosomal C-terminal domain-containing protein n=1 Tax=Kitasatospora sp. SUK 42 TaxID=1588882 RepID=UPI0018C9DD44|nr:sigma 54 modulation/S30EA ribosomal C-terminal domain-containing protein [Kitasatospora sp. SUK 42]MBV2155398.1 HPF/RaiA family ribosome-associated protein [Kitasatospora sp. SUK 42]
MNTLQSPPAVDVQVTTRGAVSLAAPEYAREKIAAVLGQIHEPVLAARVKLTQEAHHAVARPSLAQAVVDLNGRPVRVHVAAATMREAVDLLQDRLGARLARVRRQRHAAPGTWVDRDGDTHRPERVARAEEERRIVRHKAYGLSRQSAWAAVGEMEAMDYDFHLFTDAVSGCESVVYRDGRTGGHRLASSGSAVDPTPGLSVSTVAVPELTVAGAVARLELTGLPFVFFTDTASRRGNVLYHRYDGHYGLITPAQD